MILDVSAFKVFLQNDLKEKTANKAIKKKKQKSKKDLKEEYSKEDEKVSIRQILTRIKKDNFLQKEFERILNKEMEISNWFFWKDLNKIIETPNKEPKMLLSFFQKISLEYLNEESPNEVKFSLNTWIG